jgi:hypothetical protein
VDTLNRSIHLRYKGQQIEKARNPGKSRSIPKPMGDNRIIYGDKVINNRNWSVWKKRIYPEPASSGYLANGEIGVVVGHRRTHKRYLFPDCLEIEFSTQVGHVFKFWGSDFDDDDDGEASLELAYALTVHKAQGSEFEVVFLVLPRSPQMLTRELLYTALTRQKQKVIVLHQGSATDLQRLSAERYSATATRLTNLFGPPWPVAVGGTFLEDRLIHRTSRAETVRSKSEVIIANLLHAKDIDYHYEHPLELGGVVKYPDFTIEDDDAGITYCSCPSSRARASTHGVARWCTWGASAPGSSSVGDGDRRMSMRSRWSTRRSAPSAGRATCAAIEATHCACAGAA